MVTPAIGIPVLFEYRNEKESHE